MLISVEEAMQRALHGVTRLGRERVPLEAAAGRVLAEDLVAERPLPAFTYSAMDGYAVRAADFSGNGPWSLSVHGESRAGHPGPAVAGGTTCRIFTGAPIPDGADTVVIQENVERSGKTITTAQRPTLGRHIRRAGTDMQAGVVALAEGSRLHPGRLGLVATVDRGHVLVARRPQVTILSTGDELRPPGTPGSPSSIPESNSTVLSAICRQIGATARLTPLVSDDPETTEREMRGALSTTDLLITVGGASVGDHDLVRPALERIGVEIAFWGVAIKPGKPTGVGTYGSARILGLPGNPASATLTFSLFGVPILRAMQGETAVQPPRVPLRIIGTHRRRPGREEYLRAALELRDGELCAVLPGSQSSGAVTSFAQADALVVLAPDLEGIEDGDRLPVIRIADMWT